MLIQKQTLIQKIGARRCPDDAGQEGQGRVIVQRMTPVARCLSMHRGQPSGRLSGCVSERVIIEVVPIPNVSTMVA